MGERVKGLPVINSRALWRRFGSGLGELTYFACPRNESHPLPTQVRIVLVVPFEQPSALKPNMAR